MTVRADIDISFQLLELLNTAPRRGGISSNIIGARAPFSYRFNDGTGAGKVDLVFNKEQSLAASANADFDLAGSLTDSFGNTLTAAKIKGLLIANFNTAGSLQLKQAAANGLSGIFVNGAGSGVVVGAALSETCPGIALLLWPTGITVTPGTGDKINVTNNDGSNTATFRVAWIGTSA